jgi:signal transduction histidine kinase
VTFRARLLVAFVLATIIPLAILAFGVRRQLGERLVAQHETRVEGLRQVAAQDVARESRSIASRLATLVATLRTDDRFRSAVVRGDASERSYLLDWAQNAMRTAGLDMLQLQDSGGRILSSGHFRNEFDRLDPTLPRSLTAAKGAVLVRSRAPEGPFLALARIDSVRIAERTFDLVGGVKVDSAFLQRFVREEGVVVKMVTGDTVVVPRLGAGSNVSDDLITEIPLPYLVTDSGQLTSARLLVSYTIPELAALRRDVDRWFVAAMIVVLVAAFGLAFWLSRRLSDPLATLTQAASTIELEGPELTLAATRDDEIGMLARRMGSMSRRLRVSAARLQNAERRATVGDMARQVNHDIKNGLIPIRNVLRHLSQVQEQQPQNLATVFSERRSTLESSVSYLDTLARNYARLTPGVERRAVDVNEIVTELAASTAAPGSVKVRTRLAEPKPRALGDPVVVRRILDNLVRNAVESFDPAGGEVTITTSSPATGGVRIVVDDTGRGMTEEQLARAFDDFYTTKAEGTGLGLSVVRRLTTDLNGSVRVQSAPGKGTTFTIDLPACIPS